MKRVIISKNENIIAGPIDMDDPAQWLADGIAANWWGLPERNKWKDECTSEELATEVLSEEEILVQPEIPAQEEITKMRYEVSQGFWKWQDDCTQEEIDSALSSEEVVTQPASEAIPARYRTQVTLRATYTIETTDVTQEYLLKEANAHIAELNKNCDDAVLALLNGREKTTINAFALKNFWIASNLTGQFTQEEKDAALIQCGNFFQLMANIENLMVQRDTDIASYNASTGIS